MSTASDLGSPCPALQQVDQTAPSRQALLDQINAVEIQAELLDPIADLPFEISSHIFTYCVPKQISLSPRHPPILFLSICTSWRHIALATPALWADISDRGARPREFPAVLQRCVTRSQPLSISLSLRRESIEESLSPYAHQVKTILREHEHRIQSLDVVVGRERPVCGLGPTGLASLRELTFRVDPLTPTGEGEVVEILQSAPNLVCVLSLAPNRAQGASISRGQLPMVYGTSPFPLYRGIVMTHFDILPSDLAAFLMRSGTPLLHFLVLHLDHCTAELFDVLRTIGPTLQVLDIGSAMWCYSFHIPSFLDLAAFPKLENLTVRGYHGFAEQYQALVPFLRRGFSQFGLRCFSLKMEVIGNYGKGPENVVGQLRELVRAGMTIYVGTKARNFV